MVDVMGVNLASHDFFSDMMHIFGDILVDDS